MACKYSNYLWNRQILLKSFFSFSEFNIFFDMSFSFISFLGKYDLTPGLRLPSTRVISLCHVVDRESGVAEGVKFFIFLSKFSYSSVSQADSSSILEEQYLAHRARWLPQGTTACKAVVFLTCVA